MPPLNVLRLHLRLVTRRIISAILGWNLMGVGIAILLAAGRGVAPMDVLNSGLADVVGIQVGTASWIITLLCVLFALALGTRPQIGSLFTAFTIGAVINLTLPWFSTPESELVAAVQGLIGLLLLWFGALFTIASNFGPGAVDLAMLALHHRGLTLRTSRWIVEGALFAAGVALGGQIGWMSLLIVLATAPFVAHFLPKVRQLVTPAS